MTEEKKQEIAKKKLEKQKIAQREMAAANLKRRAKLAKQRERELKQAAELEAAGVPEFTKTFFKTITSGNPSYRGKAGLDKLVQQTLVDIAANGTENNTPVAESHITGDVQITSGTPTEEQHVQD